MSKRKIATVLTLAILASWTLAIVKILLLAPTDYHLANEVYISIPRLINAYAWLVRPF